MEEIVYVVLAIQAIILGSQLLVLYRMIRKPIKMGEIALPDTILIKSIIDDFTSKLTLRDEKIAELMVRLEVLEEKMKIRRVEFPSSERKEIKQVTKKPSTSNNVLRQILELLSKNSMTSTEIQRVIGKSREHVARLLKSLYEQGLVDRDATKKPFRYTITERGREALSTSS